MPRFLLRPSGARFPRICPIALGIFAVLAASAEPAVAQSPVAKPSVGTTAKGGSASPKAYASPPIRVELSEAAAAVMQKRYPENVADLRTLEEQVAKVLEAGRKATVAVQLGGAAGSGVVVSPDGLVLTAGHVVGEPGRSVELFFPSGKKARGVSLGVNEEVDSGMIRITDPGPWPYVEVAEPETIHPGDWVVAIGQPNGYFKDRAPPIRLGRVLFQDEEVINTDCTLVGGDSGGPLFNLRGQVIGIHSRIGARLTANMHVPISTYQETWDRLVAGEVWGGRMRRGDVPTVARPFLGIAGNPRADDCRITQVYPRMPAAMAGLKPGDVVLRVNDQDIRTFPELTQRIRQQQPGDKVTLRIERDGDELEIEVVLAGLRLPFPGEAPLGPEADGPSEQDE